MRHLNKIARSLMTLLAAATAAFLVCAQASANLKIPNLPNIPNDITEMTGPHYDSENDS